MQHARVAGVAIAWESSGSGPPLVLLHGFPLDHRMWRYQIESLAAGHRVIAPDLAGFGQSQVVDRPFTMQQAADDVAALLDEIHVSRAITLCGLSMGGYIAWEFFLRHRHRLEKLILCDTRAAADAAEAARGRELMAARVLTDGAAVAAEALIPKLFSPLTHQEQPRVIDQTRQVILGTSPVTIASAQRGMARRRDFTPHLADVDLPALLICGTDDAITLPDEMRQIAARMPSASFVEIPRAGHMAPLENPVDVNRAMADFLHR